ncbi:MAG: hypothetical protein WCP32_10330 [Bacteroidota bacterium]
MTKNSKTKKFEGVKTMIAIKAKMSLRYANNYELLLKDLAELHKKYGTKNGRLKKMPTT